MLNEVCANIKNYFTYEKDKHIGDFAIVDGNITPSFDIQTDYIRVVGSHLNDGVHVRDENGFGLEDEPEFHGAIWVMSVPKDFLVLVGEISDWQKKYGNVDSQAMSPFYSESFGGYSYSKAAGAISGVGSATTWQALFSSRLNQYRRIRI
jgi:hypothetical protein